MFDVMPDGVKMIDGREHYHLESSRRDFYTHSSIIQSACQSLLSPENRAKYRRAISVSFGHYLDMYTNDKSAGYWYYGPEGGSRLEHFRRNLEQSLLASSEYVWVYGEKGLFVPFADCADGWVAKQQTWEEKLPGWRETLVKTKRECSMDGNDAERSRSAASKSPVKARTSPAKPKRKAARNAVPETQGELPKKFIAAGAFVRKCTPKELLNNSESLAKSGFDGVAVSVNAQDAVGNRLGSDALMSRAKFTAARFKPFVDELKEMRLRDGLKESLLYVSLSPNEKDRLPWGSEKRWNLFAYNMGMMAKLAKASGLKGLFIDVSDRDSAGQFLLTKKDKGFGYDTLRREARRRGRAAGKAIFSAYPDIVLFSTAWFSAEADLVAPAAEPAAERLKERGSLWPDFVNGIVDEMPPTARLVDGGGNGARDAGKGDYSKAASDLFAISRTLVDGANAAKLLTALSPAAGAELKRQESEHSFWRNLAGAASTSSEYVWIDVGGDAIFGEGASALDRRIPRWRDVIGQVKDERGWIERRLRENDGEFVDLVPDPTASCGISRGYFAYIEKDKRDVAKIETDDTVGEGDGVSFKLTNCGASGTLMFRVQNVKPGDFYIVQFSTRGYPVAAKVAWRENSAFRWNVPSVGLPVISENAAGWRKASKIVRAPDMEGYNEMYLMIDMRGCKADDSSWVDNVHVYKLK
jgi:hypothetical protein